MKGIRFNEFIKKHCRDNFLSYVIVIFFICTGVVLGIYTVLYMDDFSKQELKSYINSFLSIGKIDIPYEELFIKTFINNFMILVLIWLLGLTVIGVPFTLIISLVKGFTLGFTTVFFISEIGGKSIAIIFLTTIIPNIIYTLMLIVASVLSIQFSMSLLKDKGSWRNKLLTNIGRYTILFVIIIGITMLGVAYETFVSPNFIKLFN
ncbi:putative membrane protein [Clostridium bornimense]|uniref:Putative membrane protein n=1 Tax=Clostridium bornimense TaxID=1216932 RepID=W6SFW8_9CLOT|nr:stage II sporulation protein M [Clostridium bornimense]CDM68595.1 putative membrane protein [Clostridium bornimense]